MKTIRKIFYILIAIILIPTFIFTGIILWSHTTGNFLKLPGIATVEKENFLLAAKIQTEEVYKAASPEEEAATTPEGVRGYITISKNELAAMTPSQYLEFYQNVLKGSDYLWFSVLCPDGTGLFIPDCADGSACFSSLDDLGRQIDIYGYMIVQGDSCIYQEADKNDSSSASAD